MEQTRFFSSRNFQLANTINSSSMDESWEEQAFAEDTAGALGGCIWPPRSYSCSFCGREFRSAQALGGHMNVHRRERARSKQSPTGHDENITQYPNRNSFPSMAFQYPSQVCSLVSNPSPNTIFPPSSSSRVSTPSTTDFCSERSLFSPSMAEEKEHDVKSPILWSQLKTILSADGIYDKNKRIIEQEEKTGRRIQDSECVDKENYIKADLSVSLNLVIRHGNLEVSDRMEELASGKRKRAENAPSKRHVQPEVIGVTPTSIDDLDLELRLGCRPRVN